MRIVLIGIVEMSRPGVKPTSHRDKSRPVLWAPFEPTCHTAGIGHHGHGVFTSTCCSVCSQWTPSKHEAVQPMLVQCWASVDDEGQHCTNIGWTASCLLGAHTPDDEQHLRGSERVGPKSSGQFAIEGLWFGCSIRVLAIWLAIIHSFYYCIRSRIISHLSGVSCVKPPSRNIILSDQSLWAIVRKNKTWQKSTESISG